MTMWHHFCPCEGCVIAVKLGEPCNWCDAKKAPPGDPIEADPTEPKDARQ
jgi:hypothetical protein